MRLTLLGLFCVLLSTTSFSQTQTIKGILKDSVENRNLVYTVISVLSKKDSVLKKFTRAAKDGSFKIDNLEPGEYLLFITHPYMGDYFDGFAIQSSDVEFGNIYLTPKSKLLSEVIVKSGSPIRIKGDTLVYTADSFKVRAGANVEELLRRLPGISVDKDGKITALGERVTKVLVDGEEFFGTDPGIATKNIRADAVQEVQVFDKKSDQAEFTGIDDGVKDKTINLKMKKMAGYFGKVEAGGGLKDKYDNSVMANLFKNKRKIAAYGIMSNTGQTNLDWQDAQNYGGGGDNVMSGVTDDGGMFVSISNENDYYGGRNGIPKNWNGGLHFSDKFNKEKNSFNSGYKFSKVNAPGLTETFTKNYLPDTSWNNYSRNDNFSSVIKHALNLTMDFNLDSNNSLKLTSRVNNNITHTDTKFYSEATDEDGDFINNSTRRSDNRSERNNITSSLLWRHKFKKPSRTISINTDYNWTSSKSSGLLYSLNNFYTGSILTVKDTTDQMNTIDNVNNSISTRIAYTEPLKKDFYLELSYALSYNNSKSDREINTKSITGKYEELIDSLSNSFVFNRLVNTPGLNFRVNKKKYSYAFGTSVAISGFKQKNITENTFTNYNFINFLPAASYQYKIKPNESIRINYNGINNAPTPEQLQPTRVNTDPLNVYIGNPDLKQTFRHNMSLSYNFYNVLKEKNLWSNLSYSVTDNAFVQSSTIDQSGKRTYQTVNSDGVYSINFYSDYGFKLKGSNLRLSLGPNFNISKRVEFVNGVENKTRRSNYGLNFGFNRQVPDKFNIYVGNEFAYNSTKATLSTAANAEFWSFESWLDGSVNLTKKIILRSNISAEFRQKDPRFPAKNNFTRWNADITHRFMKENKLELKLSLFDILNQNRGYDRNFSSYSFTETYFLTLKRFWLLTATWNFNKNGKPSTGF